MRMICNMTNRSALMLLIASFCVLSACSDDNQPANHNGADTGADATADAAADVATDTAVRDVATGMDAATDAAVDVAVDTAPDTQPVDAASDVPADAGADIGVDVGPDTGTDAGTPDATSADAATSASAGDTCAEALDATAGGTWDNQSTTDATDDYSASLSADNCPNGSISGKDEVWAVSPTTTTTYQVRVTPADATFDPFIYVRSDCSASACIDGTVLNGPGQAEQLTFDAPGGQTSYIIVDGELGTEGDYSISITMP